MKSVTRLFVIGLVGSAAVAGAWYWSSHCSTVKASCFSGSTAPTQTQSVVSQELGPRYRTYTPAALAEAQASGTAVLYFWAPWCVTCSSLDKELQQQQDSLPGSVTILRVEYDHATELKKQYNVVAQHTLVILDAQQQAVKTWVGGDAGYLREQLEAR